MKNITLNEQQIAYLETLLSQEYEREDISETNRMIAYKLLELIQGNENN